MNYQKIYADLIFRAKTRKLEGYKERHHIVPRCMGGGDDASNLVDLTAEEHFIAHQLLARIYPSQPKLIYACIAMTGKTHEGRKGNKAYGWIRRRCAEMKRVEMIGRTISEETRRKLREAHRPGRVYPKASEETRRKMSQVRKGRPSPLKGRPISKEHRERIGVAFKGRIVSDETRQRMAEARRQYWIKKKSLSESSDERLLQRP